MDVYEANVYGSWLANSNETEHLRAFFLDRLPLLSLQSPTAVLDVGCGRGSSARCLHEAAQKHGIDLHYTGIDPAQDQLDRFEPDMRKALSPTLFRSTLESFCSGETYDLAYVVHSLYYVPNWNAAIRKLRSFAPKGIIVHHGKRGIYEIHTEFSAAVRSPAQPHRISVAEDIGAYLRESGAKFVYEEHATQIDIRPCKASEHPDKMNMYKFFLDSATIDHNTVTRLEAWFRSRNDTLTQDVGVYLYKFQ